MTKQDYIKSYKQDKVEGDFDAIVIGSGIGGLATAAILAKEGQRILVLEQHYTAGGYTHVFKRRDYEWDVGIHYVGEVHRPYTELCRLFRYVTNDQLKWEYMGDVYDRIFFGKKEYAFVAGKEAFAKQMKTYFPDPKDQDAIDQYIALVYQAQKAGRMYFAEKALPPAVSFVTGNKMRKSMLGFSDKTTREVLEEITDNEELIGVLCGQYGDYGMPPATSSFAIHAMVVKHFMNGGNYPIGGSGKIVETMAPVIAEAGGEIFTNAMVEEILVKNKKAIGVKMKDGQEILAPIVISSAGIHNTYRRLVPKEYRDKFELEEKGSKIPASAAHLCLYIGIKETAEELNLSKANYWIYPEGQYNHDETVANYMKDPDNAPLPVVYISFPSAKDPDWLNRYPGTSTIEIITLAPYEWFKKWEETRWKKRGDEYDAFKDKFAQRMLEKLYEHEPQLKGKIDHLEISSPLSTRKFCNYDQGEIYGIDHSPERYQQKHLRVHTPIKKLYLTGQDVISCGIGGALAAGMITASSILKKDISGKIRKLYAEKV